MTLYRRQLAQLLQERVNRELPGLEMSDKSICIDLQSRLPSEIQHLNDLSLDILDALRPQSSSSSSSGFSMARSSKGSACMESGWDVLCVVPGSGNEDIEADDDIGRNNRYSISGGAPAINTVFSSGQLHIIRGLGFGLWLNELIVSSSNEILFRGTIKTNPPPTPLIISLIFY